MEGRTGRRRFEENKLPLFTRLLKIKNRTIGIVPGVSEINAFLGHYNGPKIVVHHSVSINKTYLKLILFIVAPEIFGQVF